MNNTTPVTPWGGPDGIHSMLDELASTRPEFVSNRPEQRESNTRVAPSVRVTETDAPCIVAMQKMLRDAPEAPISLAQGIVHWSPPSLALEAAQAAVMLPATSAYGADDGNPELRSMLKTKIAEQNGLTKSEIMVTTGANQAFVNVVLTLLDAGDTAMLFKPYYFNHIMALQMCGGGQPEREVIFGPTDGKMLPDVVALEKVLRERKASDHPVKMLVFTSPNNPTGMILPRSTLESISELCVKFGVWLVMDNTYEEFTYDGNEHAAIEGDHVLNIFSFSKAYGLMGWRIGYLAYPPALAPQLLKVQDTIPICPCQISQHAAIGALTAGHSWVQEHVTNLGPNLLAVREALSPLGEGAVTGGEGAIYLMCRLPPQYINDVEVVKWMAYKHGVCLIPGH